LHLLTRLFSNSDIRDSEANSGAQFTSFQQPADNVDIQKEVNVDLLKQQLKVLIKKRQEDAGIINDLWDDVTSQQSEMAELTKKFDMVGL
jgi:hypothetical protein